MIQATVVAWHGCGIMLRGPSGAGKSSLALGLLRAGARLVADDLVAVEARRGRLLARPVREPGLIEARGIGIFRLGAVPWAALGLVVDLAPAASLERLPETRPESLLGLTLPRITLAVAEPEAPARILLALAARRVG